MTHNREPANDKRLEQHSREMFDASVAGLDARTRSRLNRARQAALEAARHHSASPIRWLVPVGSAAALGLATLIAVQFMHSDDATPAVAEPNAVASSDDLEIIASNEELEMLREVEFYAWLETQPEDLTEDIGEAG